MDSLNPYWLNDNYLAQVLRSVEDGAKEVKVIKYRCQRAVPPGANYLSHLFRVSVEYKTDRVKTVSLIIKTPLESGFVREVMEKMRVNTQELKVYNEILPKMYALHSMRISATPFLCPLKSFLVLEDLRENGYKMADRLQQLDFVHCHRFLESLARFHALSVLAQQRHPELFEEFRLHPFFPKDDPEGSKLTMQEQTITIMNRHVDTVEKLEDCERFVGMIRKISIRFWDKMVEITTPGDGLLVLNHGDTWTNNIMFKYNDTGDVVDVKLVDFQLSHLNSFALDIILFWFSSANEVVRDHHREELFEVYRQTLNTTLSELQCNEALSKEDFDLEMKAKAPFAIQVTQGLLGVAMADPQCVQDVTTPETNDALMYCFTQNFKSKYYREVLPRTLAQIEDFGAFQ